MARLSDRLHSLLILIRFSGVKHLLRILRYTRWKAQLDQAYLAARPSSPPISAGRLLEGRSIASGGRFQFEQAELEVVFLGPDLVRVSWGPAQPPVPYAIARQEWPPVEVHFQAEAGGFRMTSPAMTLLLQSDGCLTYLNSRGEVLRSEEPPQRVGEGWLQRALLASSEQILGLGEQAGPLNLRPGCYQMWNMDPGGSYGPRHQPLYMPLPVILSLRPEGGSLVFYENYSRGELSFQGAEANPSYAETKFISGMLRLYFIPGSPAACLSRFTELTGRAPLPPRWSLGYHQSRWGYKTEEDIRKVAAGFQAHEMPLSAIHLDIDYMDQFKVFTIDPQRFPNLKKLVEDLTAQGIKLVTIIDPGVKQDPGYEIYQEGIQAGYFSKGPDGEPLHGLVWPGWCLYPDFTHPEARQWWGQKYASLLNAGVAGIWHDMNEPASFAASGELTAPLALQHNLEGQGGDHLQGGHNLYGLLMNRAGREALKRMRPNQRPWLVSRSGWVSQQRYSWNWTGDTESTWEALRMTIPSVIGMGLSGQPYTGPDIGGFSGSPSAELYLRSFQMATFLPFFRTHSAIGTARREPWVFGEPYTALLRDFLKLRMELMPYLYTLAWQASQTGSPLVRPLLWEDPRNPALWAQDDLFLLGDALLIAPILQEGETGRSVTLPKGVWFNFWNGETLSGDQTLRIETGLEKIPVLVKAGSILPRMRVGQLALQVYAPPLETEKRLSLLYQDAGDGYGPFQTHSFQISREGNQVRLDWKREGETSFSAEGLFFEFIGIKPRSVNLDGRETPWRLPGMKLPPFQTLLLQE